VIATLGRFSMEFILTRYNAPEAKQKISQLHGRLIKVKTGYGEASIIPLFHPAAALYNPGQKETLMADFQILKKFVDAN